MYYSFRVFSDSHIRHGHQFDWADENLIEGTVENVFSTENVVLAVYRSNDSFHAGDKIILNVNGMPQELNVVGVLSKSPFTNTLGVANIICTKNTFQRLWGESQYAIIDLQLRWGTTGTTNEDVNRILRFVCIVYLLIFICHSLDYRI